MSGKSLDDYSDAERAAYEQGCADTHERYELMQAQASSWLAAVIELIAQIETHEKPHAYARHTLAPKLRTAVGLDPAVRVKCMCPDCVKT